MGLLGDLRGIGSSILDLGRKIDDPLADFGRAVRDKTVMVPAKIGLAGLRQYSRRVVEPREFMIKMII